MCSGYGGLSVAVEAAFGATTAWHAEVDPAAARLLAAHWPDAPNHGDITAVDWSKVEPVDILAGGTPCQSLSTAGLRAGMAPGTRSGLWAAMARAVEALTPSIVIWENVHGALSASAACDLEPEPGLLGNGPGGPVLRAAGRVVGDLASLGYDAGWTTVSAADVGACHLRRRVWVVARRRTVPDADGPGLEGPEPAGRRDVSAGCGRETVTLLPSPRTSDATGPGGHGDGGLDLRTAVALLPTPRVSSERTGRSAVALSSSSPSLEQACELARGVIPREIVGLDPPDSWSLVPGPWGRYAAAVARHETVFGRPAPAATDAKGRLSPAFVEWMMMLPDGWVTGRGLTRTAELRCLGNGVVPAQGATGLQAAHAAVTR